MVKKAYTGRRRIRWKYPSAYKKLGAKKYKDYLKVLKLKKV